MRKKRLMVCTQERNLISEDKTNISSVNFSISAPSVCEQREVRKAEVEGEKRKRPHSVSIKKNTMMRKQVLISISG